MSLVFLTVALILIDVSECEFNFIIGVQLMPGLPGDSPERFLRTIEMIIELWQASAKIEVDYLKSSYYWNFFKVKE